MKHLHPYQPLHTLTNQPVATSSHGGTANMFDGVRRVTDTTGYGDRSDIPTKAVSSSTLAASSTSAYGIDLDFKHEHPVRYSHTRYTVKDQAIVGDSNKWEQQEHGRYPQCSNRFYGLVVAALLEALREMHHHRYFPTSYSMLPRQVKAPAPEVQDVEAEENRIPIPLENGARIAMSFCQA